MHQEFSTTDIAQTSRPDYTQLAAIVVHWRGKILLIHRSTAPFKDFWSIPGGNVEDGETYIQAAYRELHEETSIQANHLQPQCIFIDHDHQLECHLFSYESPDGAWDNPEPGEHDVVTWKTIPEALQLPLTPGLHEALPRLAATEL